MTTEQTIWSFLKTKNLTDYAVAGIMGNLQAESSLRSNNLEDSRNSQLGSDEIYTRNVDNGSYSRFSFINDGAGYGIAQWTSSDRKSGLYDLCKVNNKSISDITCQLTFLYEELKKYNLVSSLNNASSIQEASTIFLKKFENPKYQGISIQNSRAALGQQFYNSLKTTSLKTPQGGSNIKMKYNSSTAPLVCMQTNSTCYKGTSKMAVKGVLWHSTGANNPNIKRYVQPSENDLNYGKLMTLIGNNTAKNDWNHISVQAGLNAWVGKLADGTVASVQTMPWDYKPWGCGSGSRGSCNNGWIQFEICEDSLVDGNYFTKVYNEACELTAYLCYKYGINPKGTVNMNGINVPTILCHQDSAQLGLGSNHADVYHWFNKYGKTMQNVRDDVAKLLNGASSNNNVTPTPTPVTPSPSFSRILRKGLDGEDVKQLQENLIKLGYNLGVWGADGDFGKATEEAVIKFQQLHKLDDDGEVGPLTLAAIEKALQELAKPQIYRVRKTWDQPSTQIGAYSNLANAKRAVDNLNAGYHVYDSNGQLVYPLDNSSTPSVTPSPITPAKTYSDVMIGSASKDENGRYVNGQAGDQTGKEVYILNWYNQSWNIVLRPKTDALAEKIAQQCEAGCANNNIGYSQTARNTIYIEAQKVGLDLAKISTPCNCDCSSFVGTVCVCAGLPAKYFYSGNMPVTSTMRSCCMNTGEFIMLTGTQYTKQKDYLKRGDILLNESQHVVIVLADGNKVEKTSNQTIPSIPEGFPYKVKIMAQSLNVRKSPTESSAVTAQVRHGYIFTIVDEKEGWGKLKSGAGWINLSYTQKV